MEEYKENRKEQKEKTGSEKLADLEATEKYVFHGSPISDLKKLFPRQAKNYFDSKNPESFMLDGEPAVCASPHAKAAIFMALVNSKNIPTSYFSSLGKKGDELEFSVSDLDILKHLKGKKGYVYVFKKDNFDPYSRDGFAGEHSLEWRTYSEIEPVKIIEVSFDDLSEGIKQMD